MSQLLNWSKQKLASVDSLLQACLQVTADVSIAKSLWLKSDKSTVCSHLVIDKKENSKQACDSTAIKITITASLLPEGNNPCQVCDNP